MKIYVSIVAMLFASNLAFAGQLETKIVGGVEASMGEFPFIVSLQDSMGHFCGGSLIRQNWVLTAGHCVADGVGKVVIGLHNLNDTRNAEIIKPKRIIRHPKYNESTTDFDYALIELSQNSRYQPVDLNTADIAVPASGPEIMATVAGWGATKETNQTLPARLQKVEVPLVPQAVCNKNYGGGITDRMLCAGYAQGGKDSCQGDSGGPLVATADDHKVYLIGVVSWGEGCARANKPGVYSKVSEAVTWINQNAK
ncbi:MAG: serine protease [Bdellovibrionales bacterium]|nr:serine protease [Bdellovibrionales bacterium]